MYVIRDENGKIITAFGAEQDDAKEFLEMDDPELVEFLAPPPVSTAKHVDKITVLERMTNEEVETAEAAMAGQPAKLRQIWGAANEIWDNSPWFGDLHSFFVALFGEARTDELLEMS